MEQIKELTFVNLAPFTYLVISGLIYLAIVMFIFYRKRKIRTVENFCYGVLLWLVVSAGIEDITSTSTFIYRKYYFIRSFK